MGKGDAGEVSSFEKWFLGHENIDPRHHETEFNSDPLAIRGHSDEKSGRKAMLRTA